MYGWQWGELQIWYGSWRVYLKNNYSLRIMTYSEMNLVLLKQTVLLMVVDNTGLDYMKEL